MLSFLEKIAHTVAAFGQLVLYGIVSAVNLVIAAIGGFIGFLLGLLPQLPDVPDNPAPDAVGWIAWFIPVTLILATAAGLLVAYVLLLVWRIALRWVKAL
jgi:hypothetical protein